MRSAAEKGARVLMRHYGKLEKHAIESKSLNDFVTFVDRGSQHAVVDVLKKAFPSYGFQAEEEGFYRKEERMWIIDPLDGTANYIHQFPLFCVSIGLVERSKPVAGLIYDPVHREWFTAAKGRGTYLNGRRVRVSSVPRLSEGFIATGFPFRHKRHYEPYHRSFRQIFYRSSGLRRGGSAALDLAYTACGRLDGFWEFGLSPWDIAAGALMVEEAGGAVSDFEGRPHELDSGNIAAGNVNVHRELVAILKKIRGFR